MPSTMSQAKFHRVQVTHASLQYESSCGIDAQLLEASGIRDFQHIEIYNVSNGERFSTHVIVAPEGSGFLSMGQPLGRLSSATY